MDKKYMNIETILNGIELYGYLIISLCLFFGIVGIPAPEESFLFLIGILAFHHQLSLGLSILCSILGAFVGMFSAYIIGKYVGQPFMNKFGKYVGITKVKWERAGINYTKNARKTILFGFYMPGIRQISPYFAGMAKIPLTKYLILSLFGTILWTVPYILVGYYSGEIFHINPDYVPYYGIILLVLFMVYMLVKYLKGKKVTEP